MKYKFKAAMILVGCGFMDGSEIRESVLLHSELDEAEVDVSFFSLALPQKSVIDHLTKKPEPQTYQRSMLVESARIARGKVSDISFANCSDFDILAIPGGFGIATNISSISDDGGSQVESKVSSLILEFFKNKKPIAAVCISPVLLAAVLKDVAETPIRVTLGSSDPNNLISSLGASHVSCEADSFVHDNVNNIFSSPAYMMDASVSKIRSGISKMVKMMVKKLTF